MNIIHYNVSKPYKYVSEYYDKIENKSEFMLVDTLNYLIVDFAYYKKKDDILNKLKDSLYNNFSAYKKYIIMLNITDKIIQKYIKNNLLELSSKNRIIIIVKDINNIINELRNSFHIIYEKNITNEYLYEPLNMLIDDIMRIYKRDLDPLKIEDVEKIKYISYKICKYDIPINRYINKLVDKIITDPYFTFKLKYKLIKIISELEHKMKNSYRIIIHVENLLITIYDEIITFYQ